MPAPQSIILPGLQLLRLHVGCGQDNILIIERILPILSLARLTALPLDLDRTSVAPSLCKDVLRPRTYLRLEGSFLPCAPFERSIFPSFQLTYSMGHYCRSFQTYQYNKSRSSFSPRLSSTVSDLARRNSLGGAQVSIECSRFQVDAKAETCYSRGRKTEAFVLFEVQRPRPKV